MQPTSPHAPISSKDNATVKYLRSLADAKHRKKERTFLIEGVKMVEDALRDRRGVKLVAAAPSLTQHHGKGVIKLAERAGVDILWLSERLMDQIAESKTPQPVMAAVEMQEHSEETLLSHPSGLLVLCHRLQDPGNLGTIVRTVEATGAAGIAVTPHTVDPWSPKAVRASMGSILRVPVVKVTDTRAFLAACRTKAYQTAALTPAGGRMLFDLDLRTPTLVVVGQEGSGLDENLLKEIDLRVSIPMAGAIDSLNAAISLGVVLYEAVRQRRGR